MRRTRHELARSGSRRGITLLEVLISCGILVIGLTSLSSMLAAAGFRLTQATVEDRAAVAATNALAEVRNRGLAAASAFVDRKTVLVFGDMMDALADYGAGPSGRSPWFAGLSESASARCGSPRTFQLEDDLIYDTGQVMGSPVNTFAMQNSGPGARKLRPGVCWGATLTCPPAEPDGAGGADAEAVEGASAELAIGIFKKRGTSALSMQSVTLVKADDGTSYEVMADLGASGSQLRACSWVLAIPAASSAHPRWFRVRASWTMEPLASNLPRIVLDHQDAFENLTASTSLKSTATVIVFDGLVRLDKHTVILE
jgi:type II secretory pathway pseudopilin PulG